MYYETMLEKMARVLPGYEGSPYQKWNAMSEQLIAQYYEGQKQDQPANVNITVKGKVAK